MLHEPSTEHSSEQAAVQAGPAAPGIEKWEADHESSHHAPCQRLV